jgi:hypothetical protein
VAPTFPKIVWISIGDDDQGAPGIVRLLQMLQSEIDSVKQRRGSPGACKHERVFDVAEVGGEVLFQCGTVGDSHQKALVIGVQSSKQLRGRAARDRKLIPHASVGGHLFRRRTALSVLQQARSGILGRGRAWGSVYQNEAKRHKYGAHRLDPLVICFARLG